MNKKTSRKALLGSLLSLLLCCTMLIGTTFAWFTDEVTSGNNTITAGNLDIELKTGDDLTTTVDENTMFFDDILWEPGVVAYENLQISNEGSLALKYQMAMNLTNYNTVNGKSLKDVLKIAIVDQTFTVADGRAAVVEAAENSKAGFYALDDYIANGTLYAKDNAENKASSEAFAIVIYWEPSDVDNDYNLKNGLKADNGAEDLTIDLGINLVATQYTYEEDSFDHLYDADAEYRFFDTLYTFDSEEELKNFDPALVNPSNTAGHGLSIKDGEAVINNQGAYIGFNADLDTYTYTIEYDVDASGLADGNNVVFNSGNTPGYGSVNYVTVANDGGLKLSLGSAANNPTEYLKAAAIGETFHVTYGYSLDGNGNWKTEVTVEDGTNTYTSSKSYDKYDAAQNIFWDVEVCNPAGGVTLDNFHFYAEGGYPLVTTSEELAAAVANAEEGDVIWVADGVYTLPADINTDGITIVAAGDDVVVSVPNLGSGKAGYTISADNVTLSGLSFEQPDGFDNVSVAYLLLVKGNDVTIDDCAFDITGTNYTGIKATTENITIQDCDFYGGMRPIGYCVISGEMVVDGCEFFNAPYYGIHVDSGAGVVTVKNCDMTNVYSDGLCAFGSSLEKVVVENCIIDCEIRAYCDLDTIGNTWLENAFVRTMKAGLTVTSASDEWHDDVPQYDEYGGNVTIIIDGVEQ